MGYRYGRKIKKRKMWWQHDVEGTMEEITEEAEYQKEYLYRLLDYAEREEVPTPEEMEKMRRRFQINRQGPRAWYFRLTPSTKLTSADVIYILTSSKGSDRLSKSMGIAATKIREIRRGEVPCWEWEYDLIKKLSSIIRTSVKHRAIRDKSIYSLSKMTSPGQYEILYYATSKLKLKQMRKDMLYYDERVRLEKKGMLDEVYPIQLIHVN